MPRATVAPLFLVALAGCWSAPEDPEGSLVGLRQVDGRLEFWAGRECAGVAGVDVTVGEDASTDAQEWGMVADAGTGTVETVVVGQPPPGFSGDAATPTSGEQGPVTVVVRGEDGTAFSRTTWSGMDLAPPADDPSAWLTPDGEWVTEGDAERLADDGIVAPLCSS
ncbi:hypothetical protein BJF86_04200 [Serinicoccus sp. CNJ-927]|uniref:hypothetical protein n=1 Tax=Serinicoccus TaxID=265976 RepID=UPI0003B72552|nr:MULTISPECIES: hypothetical protein [Serinicoccus]OLT41018.1 hypothetical protein BJF86_04200 [Serinicoccus sp. CNJ-927]